MRITSFVLLAALGNASAWSVPGASNAYDLRELSHFQRTRPIVNIGPKHPGNAFPPSPPRTKACTIPAKSNGKDDSQAILRAFKDCNNGGQVIFSKDKKYIIGTALDLTFLRHVDVDIRGYVQFTNDTNYWQANAFKHGFQNATTFFQLGGQDVNVFGGGTLDGNGQVWYDLYAKDPLILRPILFGAVGLKGGSISDLNFRFSPQWYTLVANSSNVVFSNISIKGDSVSSSPAKNTDGWDTYRSDNIVIQNSRIDNGDDCVSFKPNSTNIVVQGLICNGSHGISVGSLGQYKGEVDIVENVYVYNISMSNSSDGARIKVWPGIDSALSPDLQGGGGLGSVNNVTYEDWTVVNVDYAVQITQCYGQKNLTLCNQYPSNLTITNVDIHGFRGTTSKKYDPYVGYLVCSSPNVCKNIKVSDIDVKSPKGFSQFTCTNIDKAGLAVNCTA